MRLQAHRSSRRFLLGAIITMLCAGGAASVGALPVAAAPKADLVLTATATTSPVRTPSTLVFANGTDTVTYRITVSNNGTSAAQDVAVNDVLPAGLVSSSWCLVTSTVDCSLAPQFSSPWPGSLQLGNLSSASATVIIKATAGSTLRHAGAFVNVPTVSSTTADPVPGNNSATLSTAYHTVPDAPLVRAFPGNGNTVVTWTTPGNDGGEPITQYRVTTIPVNPAGTPSSQTFDVGDPQTIEVSGLTNGTTYSFTVEAVNAVGFSDAGSSATVALSADKSAKIIGNGVLRQQTGAGTVADPVDTELAFQEFGAGTTGIGTLEETSAGAPTFCGNAPCLGQFTVVNKLEDPVVAGRYLLTIIYDKSIARGTGVSFTAYLATTLTATTGNPVPKCPKVVTATTPPGPCVMQLTRDGQNEDLKVVLSVPAALTDPKSGIR